MKFSDRADWTFPIPISYGPGRFRDIAVDCERALMTRPLIVTDRGSRDLPFVAQIRDILIASGLWCDLYSDISPNPRDDEIQAGKQVYRDGAHDGIIALGGGSGLDGAKAICLVAANDRDLWTFDFDKDVQPLEAAAVFPPLITVPTTAGTGAETESTAMITHTESMMKLCVWHPALKPRLALLDPELTLSLPRSLTAWTGCDALTHAIEAYCVPALNPLCDGIALEALRLVSTWLPTAVAEPHNINARGAMLLGSCLGGISFLKGLGMVHAISHMVGAEFDTQHGLTNAVLLPAVLRFNDSAITDKKTAMAQAIGCKDPTPQAFYRKITDLLDALEIPKTLAEIGVTEECAPQIARKASRDAAATTNPRQASVKEIEAIIEDALTVGR